MVRMSSSGKPAPHTAAAPDAAMYDKAASDSIRVEEDGEKELHTHLVARPRIPFPSRDPQQLVNFRRYRCCDAGWAQSGSPAALLLPGPAGAFGIRHPFRSSELHFLKRACTGRGDTASQAPQHDQKTHTEHQRGRTYLRTCHGLVSGGVKDTRVHVEHKLPESAARFCRERLVQCAQESIQQHNNTDKFDPELLRHER